MGEEIFMPYIARAVTAVNVSLKKLFLASNKDQLLSETCAAITDAGYISAWVGLLDPNDNESFQSIAQSGFAEGTEEIVASFMEKGAEPLKEVNTALKTGNPQRSYSTPESDRFKLADTNSGYNASLSIPLISSGQVVGVLVVCASEQESFSETEERILSGISQTVANVLDAMEMKAPATISGSVAELVFKNSTNGIMISDNEGVIKRVNHAFFKLTGVSSREATGKYWEDVLWGHREEERIEAINVSLTDIDRWSGGLWIRRKDGEALKVNLDIEKSGEDGGTLVSSITDVFSSKNAADEIRRQAHYDSLTGLAGKSLFMNQLKQGLARARRSSGVLAVLFLDLDNFKVVNESLSHEAGDELLKEVADRLTQCVREVDTVARLGGDEFMVILENLTNKYDVTVVARKIIKSLALPITVESEEVFITVSLGMTIYPDDGGDEKELTRNAELAMYSAKDMGKNNFQIYDGAMNEKAIKRLHLEKRLRRAVERGELVDYYQPKVDLLSNRVMGMEALVRWRQDDGTMASPVDFIPLAEETGLIVGMDEWMLSAVCEFIRELDDINLDTFEISLSVSVNLSAMLLEKKDLVATIENNVAEWGLKPSQVELEVTESSVIKHMELAVETLGRLREKGFNISMDDFGTGYSSLSYLTKLPINVLKIDRAFVIDLPASKNAQAVARAIVSMSHELGIKVIAEGVETLEQLEFLRGIGCNAIQGYYFSPPVPKDQMIQMLRDQKHL